MRTKQTIGTVTASGISAVLLWSGVMASGQEATPAAKDPQTAMQEIDRKIEELQQQKESLQQQAEQQEVILDLQNQARDRKEEISNELIELGSAEATDSQAIKAEREGRIQHLETQKKAIADVMAAKEAAALPKVREIFAQMADRDIEWDLVLGPRYQAAIMLEDLENQANGDEGSEAKRKLLERIRVLCKENATAREAQFKAAKAAASNWREIEKLVEKFHSGN